MANPVDKFKDFSAIIQNVDVSDIVTSLAKGIAEAQVKLDNNSIQQAILLAQQQVGGKSLIEHGFVPPFYSFEYADVSASINLKMRQSEKFNIGGNLEFDNYRKLGYKKDTTTTIEKDREDKSRKEYRSSNDVAIRADSSRHVKIESQRYKLDHSKKAITMIEDFEKALESESSIQRVYHQKATKDRVLSVNSSTSANVSIQEQNGFIIISFPKAKTKDWGLLKLTDYNGDTIELSSSISFTVDNNDFAGTSSAAAGQIGSNDIVQVDIPRTLDDINIYFGYNKHEAIDYTYQEGTYGNTDPNLELKLQVIALILEHDPSASITITGHTDRSGGTTYNKTKLSKWRATTIKNTLKQFASFDDSQITLENLGESLADTEEGDDPANDLTEPRNPKYRRADISLDFTADYIFFIGTDFSAGDATPDDSNVSTTPNYFIETEAGQASYSSDLIFTYGTDTDINFNISESTNTALLDAVSNHTSITDSFYSEKRGSLLYLLHKKVMMQFTALSENSDKVLIEEDISQSDSEKSYREEVEVYESVNKNKYLQKSTENLDNPGFIAFSGGIDARYEKQFTIDMSANASVAARMKTVPPPAEFLSFIKDESGSSQ